MDENPTCLKGDLHSFVSKKKTTPGTGGKNGKGKCKEGTGEHKKPHVIAKGRIRGGTLPKREGQKQRHEQGEPLPEREVKRQRWQRE